jgi:hypothetical protein
MEDQPNQTPNDPTYGIAVIGLLTVCSVCLILIYWLVRYLGVML